MRGLLVRPQRVLVGPLLEEEEHTGIVRVTMGAVLQAARLGAGRLDEPAEQVRDALLLTLAGHPANAEDDQCASRRRRRTTFSVRRTCARASEPARATSPARIASTIGVWKSTISIGSKYVQ